MWKNVCYAKVEEYRKMKERGDKDEDVALCMAYQLKRIGPECERYRQLFFWAMHTLDRAVIERYGFGTTRALPFPIGMHNTQFYSHDGNELELYCIPTESPETSGEEEHEETSCFGKDTLEGKTSFFSQLVSCSDL
jgi:hypothetical protein